MKLGKCPKCQASNIFPAKGYGQRSWLYLNFWTKARVEELVCLDCGFTESYVSDNAKLAKFKNNIKIPD